MQQSTGFKLGKVFGLIVKRLNERGYRYRFDNVLYGIRHRTDFFMSEIRGKFRFIGASDSKTESEIEIILSDISKIPEKLNSDEYCYFWFGYYSNFKSEG